MMIHPVGLPTGAGGLAAVTPTLAVQTINVAFRGRTAHAAGAPWDGINALDAAHVAYAAVSALRQQMRTSDRVHGIIVHGGEAPNSEFESWGCGLCERLRSEMELALALQLELGAWGSG
jgi:metal-dependent amidase/aminoacylase/carboxypeptidase family protein